MAAWPVHGVAAEGRTQRGLPGVETRLVGRSRELGLGREALEALRSGRGGVLVVSGDAGIGKTRLLNELRELAEREGSSWLEGRCVSYGESLPYWPFRDLLRGEWIGAGAEEPELRVRVGLRRRLEQLFDGKADELYPYLGGLLEVALEHEAAARTSELSPEALQWRTFEVVGQLFARLTESAPLVLAFEDLHWADATSVLLLEQLLSLAEEAPVLLVLSLRPERDHGSWALREHAGREFPHLLREIDLGPLGRRLEASPAKPATPGQEQGADGELLAALVAPATLPAVSSNRAGGLSPLLGPLPSSALRNTSGRTRTRLLRYRAARWRSTCSPRESRPNVGESADTLAALPRVWVHSLGRQRTTGERTTSRPNTQPGLPSNNHLWKLPRSRPSPRRSAARCRSHHLARTTHFIRRPRSQACNLLATRS